VTGGIVIHRKEWVMSDLSNRILRAVQGDSSSIQTLAIAVAQKDADGVRGILSARGLDLNSGEIDALFSQVGSGSDPSACTCTCTCT